MRRYRPFKPLLLAVGLALGLVTFWSAGISLPAQTPTHPGSGASMEAKIKVALIYNLLKFVEWPDEKTRPAKDPMRICVIGDDPIRHLLGELTSRTISERPITVTYVSDLQALPPCQALYISAKLANTWPTLLPPLTSLPILTISDMPQFVQNGGMIGFILEQQHLKMEIGLAAVQRVNLSVRAKLLEVAKVVQ